MSEILTEEEIAKMRSAAELGRYLPDKRVQLFLRLFDSLIATLDQRTKERDRLVEAANKAIDDEPECPGDMPDEMWNALNGCDRETMAETLRLTVRLTKEGIKERLAAALKEVKGD